MLDADEADWQALRESPRACSTEGRRIDVWWFDGASSRLALLFAYLMTRTDDWDDATIQVVAPSPADATLKTESSLQRRLEELRIDAAVRIVAAEDGPTMYQQSADANFVLLPLRLEGMNTLHPAGGPVHELFDTLPVVAMVAASGDVKLTPDEDTADPGSEDGDESQVADGTSPTSSDKEP